VRQVARGALLIAAGSPAEALYVLRRGHVRVYRLNEAAAEATTAVLGPGQAVGLSVLLGEAEYQDFAEALTPVEVWVLCASRLSEQLTQHPALAAFLADALLRRLSFEVALLHAITFEPVASRVVTVVGELGLVDGGVGPAAGGDGLRLTRELLAALVGARRETISRTRSSRLAGVQPVADGPKPRPVA
jgi:CRP/FNR family transcriptional regulator